MTTNTQTPAIAHGSEAFIPLNRLKKSPRNARKTGHRPEDIEALAGSIQTKGMLQPPVVEPELSEDGQPTGCYLVTIGEGRRQAMLLRAKRKQIKRSEPVRCVIDTENDAHEISLDENVTRFNMHPADQFEAFKRLSDERGLGAEEIAARFGVSPTVVRQRLRLSAVSPRLLSAYRAEEMTLEQLMAFAVTDDHERQELVWESLPPWDNEPSDIRRLLTRDRVPATDRRAVLVGADAYQAAGGVIERDLFADDRGGYFTDPELLERLARDKLQAIADELLSDGWKWASLEPDFSLGRLFPKVRDFTEDEQARYDALCAEQALIAGLPEEDRTEAEVERLRTIPDDLKTLESACRYFEPGDKARAGVLVLIGYDGQPKVEYGYVRPEDHVSEADADESGQTEPSEPDDQQPSAKVEPGRSPLSDKLVADLTAHKTAAMRDALARNPDVAFTELLYAFSSWTFGQRHRGASCLDIRATSEGLERYAPGIEESVAQSAIRERHETWAARLSASETGDWGFVASLDRKEALALLAHCLSFTVNAVETRDRRDWDASDTPADHLAKALSLDMTAYWSPTAASYFNRVSKGRILEAVSEAVSEDAAKRLVGAKKADLSEAAEQLIGGTGWRPEPLRGHVPEALPEAQAAE